MALMMATSRLSWLTGPWYNSLETKSPLPNACFHLHGWQALILHVYMNLHYNSSIWVMNVFILFCVSQKPVYSEDTCIHSTSRVYMIHVKHFCSSMPLGHIYRVVLCAIMLQCCLHGIQGAMLAQCSAVL